MKQHLTFTLQIFSLHKQVRSLIEHKTEPKRGGEALRERERRCECRLRMSVFGVFIAAVQHQPQWAEVLEGKGAQTCYTSGLIVTYTNIYYTWKQIKGALHLTID